MAENAKDGIKISRRKFIKGVTFIAASMGGLALNGYAGQEEKSLPEVKQNGFYTFIDNYDASTWVMANVAIAVKRINGAEIPPGGTVSMIKLIGLDTDPSDTNNTDPKKGYVAGFINSNLDKVAGAGICKTTTDLFRCALNSPLLIPEAHTHSEILDTYFKKYPLGTDASIYIEGENKIDLMLTNPFNVPLKINYNIRDTKGNIVDPVKYFSKLFPTDYAINLINYGFRYLRANQIKVPPGFIQDKMGITKLITSCSFEPVAVGYEKWNWDVNITKISRTPQNQYSFKRTVKINNIILEDKQFTSEYLQSQLANIISDKT